MVLSGGICGIHFYFIFSIFGLHVFIQVLWHLLCLFCLPINSGMAHMMHYLMHYVFLTDQARMSYCAFTIAGVKYVSTFFKQYIIVCEMSFCRFGIM